MLIKGWVTANSIQFNSILLFYLDITYNNLILIYNVVQTMDDQTNNILCTTYYVQLDTQDILDKNYEKV